MNENSKKMKSKKITNINSEREETPSASASQLSNESITDNKNTGASEQNRSDLIAEAGSNPKLFQTSDLNSQLDELREQGLLDASDLEDQISLDDEPSSEVTNKTEINEEDSLKTNNEESQIVDEDNSEETSAFLDKTSETDTQSPSNAEVVELKSLLIDEDDDEKENKSKLKEYAFLRSNTKNDSDIFSPEREVVKEKRKKTAIISILSVVALLVVVYAGGVFFFKDRFLPNTYVNGAGISAMTLDEADETVSSLSKDRTVKLLGSDGLEEEIKASDVGFILTEMPDLAKALEDQNAFSWPIHLLPNQKTDINNDSKFDDTALNNTIASLKMVSGPQVVKTENARAEYNKEEDKFEIRKEVYGTEVDVPKLTQRIRESLTDGNSVINLEEEDDYVRPITHEDSEVLAQSVDKLNSIKNEVITYDFKLNKEILDKNAFIPWLTTTETGEPTVRQDMVAAYVAALAQKYDTLDKPVNFMTSTGTPIQVHDWVAGWEINQPQEVAELTNALLGGQSVTREPVYSSIGRDRMANNSIVNNYLEISISDQHMWFYKNGQLLVETPIVTGDPSSGNGTPEGLFNLQDKETDVTLTGADYASPVTYWLPFDGGVGVHDASWRGSYGGSIYYGNGSHGCVNTPYSAVEAIYENIDVGVPVVVYSL